jgi:hypothetical protein
MVDEFWWEETADLYDDDIELCIAYLRNALGKSELLLENRHAFQRLSFRLSPDDAICNHPTDILLSTTNLNALSLRRRKPHFNSIQARTRQRQRLLPLPRIPTLNRTKLLHQPNRHITRFRQRILLPQTDPRAAVERQVLPARPQRLPALGSVLVSVGPVDVLAAMHGVGRVPDHCAFGDEERVLAVGAAAEGEDGVADGEA